MRKEIDETALQPAGNLLDAARMTAHRLRELAKQRRGTADELYKLRNAVLLDELVRYGEDRDKEIARLVREAALLRARVEDYEAALKSA